MIGAVRPEALYALPTARMYGIGAVWPLPFERGERPKPITRALESAAWIES